MEDSTAAAAAATKTRKLRFSKQIQVLNNHTRVSAFDFINVFKGEMIKI